MGYLLDSNILVRTFHRNDPQNVLVRLALRKLAGQGEALYFVPQNIAEVWNVCTRPVSSRGGYGLTVANADRITRLIDRQFKFLPDNVHCYYEWRKLLLQHSIQGASVYDARLVATMRIYGISHILTLNDKDFRRYPGITAVHPANV